MDSVEKDRVTALFVDYGTLNFVDRNDIRLNTMLKDLPIQEIWCVMKDIRLLVLKNNLKRFHDFLVGKKFRVRVEAIGPPVVVVLKDEIK